MDNSEPLSQERPRILAYLTGVIVAEPIAAAAVAGVIAGALTNSIAAFGLAMAVTLVIAAIQRRG